MKRLDPAKPYCVIPARFASTRFPGKPLVPLLGKPMILWVAEACALAVGKNQVIVATEDHRITDVVESAGFHSETTSPDALTGTDRVAEVAAKIGGDTILNVQGDEPLVSPSDIRAIAAFHQKNPHWVINCYTEIGETEDPLRLTIPKVVLDQNEHLLYASRAAIPASKKATKMSGSTFLKQVCIYAFSAAQLAQFSQVREKTPLERAEDIEILRFLEMGQTVRMVRTEATSVAVDEPRDVADVEHLLVRSTF